MWRACFSGWKLKFSDSRCKNLYFGQCSCVNYTGEERRKNGREKERRSREKQRGKEMKKKGEGKEKERRKEKGERKGKGMKEEHKRNNLQQTLESLKFQLLTDV